MLKSWTFSFTAMPPSIFCLLSLIYSPLCSAVYYLILPSLSTCIYSKHIPQIPKINVFKYLLRGYRASGLSCCHSLPESFPARGAGRPGAESDRSPHPTEPPPAVGKPVAPAFSSALHLNVLLSLFEIIFLPLLPIYSCFLQVSAFPIFLSSLHFFILLILSIFLPIAFPLNLGTPNPHIIDNIR